jgi:hypothetical protein
MTRGGKRENSGRLPVDDKKIQIPFYIRRSILEKHGRKELREKVNKFLDKL